MPSALAPIARRSESDRLDADATALHDALSELVRVYQFRDRDRICCHDVSVTQCYAIEALLRRGPSGLNELATELYLDKSTASRVVATLERKGYVTRAPHPEDGRAIVLSVTAAGRRPFSPRARSPRAAPWPRSPGPSGCGRAGAARLILRLARSAASRSGVPGASCCSTKAEE
jgi:MarR family transcriptional regulator, 2-MHQ and catechol-resistance regulon repressor